MGISKDYCRKGYYLPYLLWKLNTRNKGLKLNWWRTKAVMIETLKQYDAAADCCTVWGWICGERQAQVWNRPDWVPGPVACSNRYLGRLGQCNVCPIFLQSTDCISEGCFFAFFVNFAKLFHLARNTVGTWVFSFPDIYLKYDYRVTCLWCSCIIHPALHLSLFVFILSYKIYSVFREILRSE